MPAPPARAEVQRLRRWWPALLGIAAASALLAEGAWRVDVLGTQELAWRLEDRLLTRWRAGALRSTGVMVLAIDDPTLEGVAAHEPYRQHFGSWPFTRTLWGRLVAHLGAQGVRAVVLDAVLEGPSEDPAHDENLALALEAPGAPPFFAGLSLSGTAPALPLVPPGTPRPTQSPTDAAQLAQALVTPISVEGAALPGPPALERHDVTGRPVGSTALRPAPPAPRLAAAVSGWGLVTGEPDPDGVMRRTRFVYEAGGQAWPTLAVAVAARLAGPVRRTADALVVGTRRVALDGDGSARLDFGGPFQARFDTVSLIHVLDDLAAAPGTAPKVGVGRLAGKVVVIGGFSLGTGDSRATALEREVPGVVKHATELDALLAGGFLRAAPAWPTRLALFLLALGVVAVVVAARRWYVEASAPLLGPALAWVGCGLLVELTGQVPWVVPGLLAPVIAALGGVVLNRAVTRRDAELLREVFGRYMERQLVDRYVEGGDLSSLEARQQEVTAFFSDIRGFSTFSESLRDEPERLKRVLNVYLTRVTAALASEGACVDKYIGDAVVALFGAPVPFEDHARRACRAALKVQAAVATLREEFAKEGLPDVATRIGLNTDVMLVGNFGSEQLVDYTAIGDGMNLAARLEAANKAFKTSILVGPNTARLVAGAFELRELDSVTVPGKQEVVTVYELLCEAGQLGEKPAQVREFYRRALAAHRERHSSEAVRLLDAALQLDPEDGPSRVLRARAEAARWEPERLRETVRHLEK